MKYEHDIACLILPFLDTFDFSTVLSPLLDSSELENFYGYKKGSNLSISRRQCVQNRFLLHSSNIYTMRYDNIIKTKEVYWQSELVSHFEKK